MKIFLKEHNIDILVDNLTVIVGGQNNEANQYGNDIYNWMTNIYNSPTYAYKQGESYSFDFSINGNTIKNGRIIEDGELKLLFIKNPENDLHPNQQLDLVNQLVYFTSMGFKIVITTHSDIILKGIKYKYNGARFYHAVKEDFKEVDRDSIITISEDLNSAYEEIMNLRMEQA